MDSSSVVPVKYEHKIITYRPHFLFEWVEVTVTSTVFEEKDEEFESLLKKLSASPRDKKAKGGYKSIVGDIPGLCGPPRLFDDVYDKKWKEILKKYYSLSKAPNSRTSPFPKVIVNPFS